MYSIFLPILLESVNHWVLVEVLLPFLTDTDRSTPIQVTLYDSLAFSGVSNEQIFKFVKQYLTITNPRSVELENRWPASITRIPVPLQVGSTDCGIHVVNTMIRLIRREDYCRPSETGTDFCNRLREEYTRLIVKTYLDKHQDRS